MSVMELLASRRTYRRFEQKAVPQDVVEDIIEALRLSSCRANRQAVRLVVVNRPEDVARVQPLVKWAAYLPPEQGTPKADELPTLYVAVVQDTSIPGDLATDTGIALANMTLAAWAKGVGSCIMGAINKPALTRLLGIEEPQKLAFMVAFGYPAHKAGIVPLTEQTGCEVLSGRKPGLLRAQAEQGRDCKVSVTGNGLVQTPSVALRAPAPAAREAARHLPWRKEFLHICSFSFSAMHNCYQFGFKSSDFLHKY